jgi:mannose/fructose/N-acetylgalactosamine-specific phosphotransferase system component IIC
MQMQKQNKNNKSKLLTLGFLVAVIASMTLVTISCSGIKTALGQGTNETSTSGMNMTGTEGASGGGTANK